MLVLIRRSIVGIVLLTVATTSFADIEKAPINVCLTTVLAATPIQEELSYPGEGGIWSGYINTDHTTCMHPYDWKTAPGIFDVYAVKHGEPPFNVPNFYQCSPGMTTSHGKSEAPKEEDFEIGKFNNSNYPYCKLKQKED